MSGAVGGRGSGARLEDCGSPTFDDLAKAYRLRSRSVLFWLGALLVLAGFSLASLSLGFSLVARRPFLGIDLVALTAGWLAPGMAVLVLGAVLVALDGLKRRLVCPYPFEVLNDFLRLLCQEGVFPSSGISKSQFRFKVGKRRGVYRIDFSLDAPGCSYEELRPRMRRIAESLGCADTFAFVESAGRASRYTRGYRYRFEVILKSAEEAYAKAGEYRG